MNAPTGSGTIPSVMCPDSGARPVRYDAPPSIYVEDYDSPRGSSHSSREMIRIEETGEPETPPMEFPLFEVKVEAPSTDSNLSFVADVNLDDIPYIDDDEDEERVGFPNPVGDKIHAVYLFKFPKTNPKKPFLFSSLDFFSVHRIIYDSNGTSLLLF